MATIREILTGVKLGTLDLAPAEMQIQAHIDAAVAAVDCRARYAAAALQGNITAGKKFASREALAAEVLAVADAVCAAQ